jgi:hypothetical protein
MNEIQPIGIAESADLAARRCVETGEAQPNPHERGTDEFKQWKAAYERFLLRHSSPESEASA